MLYNETLNAISLSAKACNFLYLIFLVTSVSLSSVFICFRWCLIKKNAFVKFNASTQTAIYRVHINGKQQRNKY